MATGGRGALPMAADKDAPPEAVARRPPIVVDGIRGVYLESRHVVFGLVLESAGRGAAPRGVAWGDPEFLTFARSAWKPFQALPFILDGVMDAFGYTDRELALAVASHSAQGEHLEVLERMLERAGLDPAQLRCPGHAPIHDATAKATASWDRRHDNCSGKHAAMLAWCRKEGLDPTGYTEAEHPVQERILDLVCALADLPRREVAVARDGCTAAAFAVPLARLASMYLFLADPTRLPATREGGLLGAAAPRVAAALARVTAAMAAHPRLVAGEGRVDTDLAVATGGRMLSKSGAEGVWCGVDRERGLAFAFKAIDGGFRAVVPAAIAALAAYGVFQKREIEALGTHAEPIVKDRSGGRVGRLRAVLP